MESIIEFIFDNIFFVLIILFALMNLFGRSKEEENQERKQPQRRPSPPQRTEVPNERRQIPKPVQTTVEEMLSEAENHPTTEVNPTGFEDQRQAQFERLRQQYQTTHSQVDIDRAEHLADDLTKSTIQVERPSDDKREKIKPNFSEKLTHKGLIESVIMAEVLGPPKARQRFSKRYHR